MEAHKTVKLSESEEGYVETIHSLIEERGYARVSDIAAALGVKPPSVTSMVRRLDEQKFVDYTRYRGVVLTRKGRQLAEALGKRHRALKAFLVMIGVSEENAERDACEIEHKMNRETVEKLAKFVEFVHSAPKPPMFLKHFRSFEETGRRPDYCKSNKTK